MARIPGILIFVFILSACSSAPEVSAVKVATGTVEATVSSLNSGTIKSEKLAELAFGAVGRVQKLNVRLGDLVKAGQVLAELENVDLYQSMVNAETEAKRQDSLFKSHATSPADRDRADSDFELARGIYEKTLIRAPFDGLIVEVNLEVGQLSQITAIIPKALIRIVDMNPRYVRAEIDEVDLSRVKVGQRARVKVLAVRREPFEGVVRKVIPFISSIREQDRSSEVELDVDGGGRLLPVGASADVEIVVDQRHDVTMVPFRVILGRGEARHVFRYSAGRIIKTPVDLGLYNYDRAEVKTGVAPGDPVVYPTESIEFHDGLKVRMREKEWP